MTAWDKIKGIFRKKKLNVISIDSDNFSDDDKLKAVLNENAYLKGRLLKQKTKDGEERQREQDKKEEGDRIKDLNKQYEELRKETDKPVSLQLFFDLIKKREKENKPIIFTTFDAKDVLGNAHDILFYPDGNIGVSIIEKGKKKVIWASQTLEDVFYWISGLNNYIKKGMIPLCVDRNGNHTPNLMEQEVPEWVRLSNDKFKVNRFNKKKVYELIQEKDEQIQELGKEMKSTEEVVTEQQKEIHDKDREVAIHQSRADKSESELSIALDKIGEIGKAQGKIARENQALNNMKEVHEETVERMERIISRMASKVEKEGSSSTRDKVWEELKEIVEFAKNNLGNQVIMPPEKEEPSLEQKYGPPVKP